MRIFSVLFIVLVLVAGSAWGQSVQCRSSERFDGALVRVGDSERRVIEAEPDRVVQVETRQGGAAGYRLDFYKRGRTVQVYVRHGLVVRICSIRELSGRI